MKLSEIIQDTISGDWGNDKCQELFDTAVKCLRSADIVPIYQFNYSGIPIRYVSHSSLEKRQLQKGDIVIEKSGGTDTCSTGRPIYISSELLNDNEPLLCSNFCSAIRLKDDWNSEFVYYLLRLIHKLGLFFNFEGKTSGIHNLDMEAAFKAIEIPSISNNEQECIANILSALDRKIALNRKENEILEKMAKQLYDYWFVQFDFPDENGRPYKSSGGKMVYNEKLKREIPEGWEVSRLGDTFKHNRGISYNTQTITGEGIPMVNLASFNVDGTYKPTGIKKFNGIYSKDKILKPYDLVLCNTQQTSIDFSKDIIGKAFLVPNLSEGDIVYSHHVTSIRPYNDDLKAFYCYLFNTCHFHKYAARCSSGTNIMGLDFCGIERYETELPPSNILNYFSNYIIKIQKRKSVLLQKNQQLNSLRDFLLPLLMNGQVTIKD